jgi:hypothetical protein
MRRRRATKVRGYFFQGVAWLVLRLADLGFGLEPDFFHGWCCAGLFQGVALLVLRLATQCCQDAGARVWRPHAETRGVGTGLAHGTGKTMPGKSHVNFSRCRATGFRARRAFLCLP